MNKIQIFPYEMAAHLIISGEDAGGFLQSQFTNDLRPFEAGRVSYGLWLDVKGKVVADSWVCCEGSEHFRVLSEHCSAELIQGKLEQHIVADDVEIEVLPVAPALAVLGALPDSWEEVGDEGLVLPGRRSVEPSWEYVFNSEEVRERFMRLNEAERISEDQIQLRRLEAGVPMVPAEIGPRELPGEGGLDRDAIAFNKGCFLGQEVVARMHHVGQARRGLYLMRGAGQVPESPQTLLNEEGKTLGELRTAYPNGEGWLGVALLKRHHLSTAFKLKAGLGPVQLVSEFGAVGKECSNG